MGEGNSLAFPATPLLDPCFRRDDEIKPFIDTRFRGEDTSKGITAGACSKPARPRDKPRNRS